MRVEINPALIERPFDHIMEFLIEIAEYIEQIVACLFGRISFIALTHRRKKIVPRQTVFVSERFCLNL